MGDRGKQVRRREPAGERRSSTGSRAGGAPVSVLLVDDHPIWRQTIRKILELRKTVHVAAEAADGDEAVAAARTAQPDVVVMDIDMPGTDGLAATKRILEECPGARVLMLSASSEPAKIGRAVRAGATGYLVKTAKPDEVVDAVRRVASGELVFPAEVADAVMEAMRSPRDDDAAPVRVALADGSVLDREGLAGVLRTCGFEVPHQVARVRELARSFDPMPDVAVISLGSAREEQDQIDAILEIRRDHPDLGILILSHAADGSGAERLLSGDSRGCGWLLKRRVTHVAEVRDAIRRVARGEAVVDPDVVGHLVRERERHSPVEDLSDREREVLERMAEGRSNQAISEQLHMAPKTVEGHVANIFMKLGLVPTADDHRRVLAVLAYLRSL